jgi:hypothetical protein
MMEILRYDGYVTGLHLAIAEDDHPSKSYPQTVGHSNFNPITEFFTLLLMPGKKLFILRILTLTSSYATHSP